MPKTVDIELDGFVHIHDRADAVVRPSGVTESVLQGRNATPYGTCRDVTGVFREQAAPPVPHIRLLGRQPETALRTALDTIGQQTKASLRRRRIHADVYTVAADGTASQVIDAVVSGTVESAKPSPLGTGLVDVTVNGGC